VATLKRDSSGNYILRFYSAGRGSKRVYENLGKISYKDALDKAAEFEAKRRAPKSSDPAITFSRLAALYFELHGDQLAEQSAIAWNRCLSHLSPHFGKSRVADLHPVQVERYRNDRKAEKKPPKPETLNQELRFLLTVLHFGERRRIIEANPFRPGEITFEPVTPKTVYMEPEEWARFIEAAATLPGAACTVPAWRFLILTGSRISEAAGLDWKDVDREAGTVRIRQPKTAKHGKAEKTLVIVPELAAVFDSLERGIGAVPVFRDQKGKRWRARQLAHRFFSIIERAGIVGVHGKLSPHALRHTAATLMRRANIPLDRIGEVLGHTGTANTLRYAHIRPTDLSDALGAIGSAIGGRVVDESTLAAPIGFPINEGRKTG
jgi:integrase